MFVLSKRNIVLPSPDGSAAVRLRRGDMADLPDWAANTEYFQGLVADGKLVVTGKDDKTAQKAAEKPVKTRRGKVTTEE